MKRETTGKATEPIRRMLETISAVDPIAATTSVRVQCFHNRTRDRRPATCSRTVFKARRLDRTHRNTRQVQRRPDHRHRVQVHHHLAFHHLLRTLLVHRITDQLAVDHLAHRQATVLSSADLVALDQHSVLNLDLVDQTTLSVVDHHSWAHLDRPSTVRDTQWVDLVI